MAIEPTYQELQEKISFLQEKLSVKEDLLEVITNQTEHDAYIIIEIKEDTPVIHTCNKGAEYLLKYRQQELQGQLLWNLFPLEEQKKVKENLDLLEGGNDSIVNHVRVLDKKQHSFPAQCSFYPLQTIKDNIHRYIIILTDLSESIETEKNLQREKMMYQTLFESTGAATCCFGDDRILTLCNHKFEQLSGFSKEEVEGKMKWSDFVDEEDLIKMEKYHDDRSKGSGAPPTEYEFGFVDRYGHRKIIYLQLSQVPGSQERIASLTDITALSRAKADLRESNELFSSFVNEIPNAIFMKDKDFRMFFVNNYIHEKMGGHRWLNKTNQEAFPKDIADKLDQNDKKVFQNGAQDFLESLVDKDGEVRYFRSYKFLIERYPKTPFLGGFSIDITDKIQTEKELEKSELRFAKLFNNTTIGITFVGLDYRIFDVNSAYCSMLGYTKEEIAGTSIWNYTLAEKQEYYRAQHDQLVQGQKDHLQMEKVLQNKNGTFIYTLLDISLIRDEMGNPAYFIEEVANITERKQAELKERETRRMLETLMGNLPGMVYRCENIHDWRMVYLSKGCKRITGYTEKDLLHSRTISYGDLIHEDDRDFVWRNVQSVIREGNPFEIEYRILNCRGQVRWMWERGQLVNKGKDGKEYLEGFIMDITERKTAINRLRESEEKYRVLAETAQDIICIHDLEGNVQYLNTSGQEKLGYAQEHIKGKKVDDFMPEPERKAMRDRKNLRKTGDADKFLYETYFYDAQGEKIPVEISSSPLQMKGGLASILLIARDLRERKRTEKQLRENEQWYRILFETTGTATFIFGEDRRIISCNREFESLTGYRKSEIEGKMKWSELVHKDDLPRMEEYHRRRSMAGEDPPPEYEFKLLDKQRKIKYIHIKINMIEQTTYRVASFVDLTVLKNAQESLRVSEERLKLAIDSVGLGLWDWNIATGGVFFNRNWSRMLGFEPEEITPQVGTWEKLVHPEDWTKVKKTLYNHIEGKTNVYFTEHRLKTKEGGYRWISDRGKVVFRDYNGKAIRMIGIHNDITERKEAELKLQNWNRELAREVKERTEQLEETNRELESFSYSVSHDLKAPLRAISSFSEILEEEAESKLDGELLRYLNIIKTNASKMNQLISDLLSFARLGKKSLKLQKVNTIQLIREVYREQMELHHYKEHEFYLKPVSNVFADYAMLKIVFSNLISNAFKFSKKDQMVEIEIGELAWEGRKVLYVKDNGVGFNMKYVDKVFGAFQRLHKESEFPGTGIGLSLVQRVIHKHGGKIWVESQSDEGATFYFYLGRFDNDKKIV